MRDKGVSDNKREVLRRKETAFFIAANEHHPAKRGDIGIGRTGPPVLCRHLNLVGEISDLSTGLFQTELIVDCAQRCNGHRRGRTKPGGTWQLGSDVNTSLYIHQPETLGDVGGVGLLVITRFPNGNHNTWLDCHRNTGFSVHHGMLAEEEDLARCTPCCH